MAMQIMQMIYRYECGGGRSSRRRVPSKVQPTSLSSYLLMPLELLQSPQNNPLHSPHNLGFGEQARNDINDVPQWSRVDLKWLETV